MDATYIRTAAQLKEAIAELEREPVIAVDIECENNLHHYGIYTALIQISSRSKNYLVDTLSLKEETKLLHDLFANQHIRKVFHDVSFDIRLLTKEFGFDIQNIYDTQLAVHFLNKEKLGLGDLLEEYFGVTKKKQHQKGDWTRRPLSASMLTYAINDTKYLLSLYDKLVAELKEQGKYEWVEEEAQYLGDIADDYTITDYTSVRTFSKMEPLVQRRVKGLYELREELAKSLNRPNYFIFSNRILVDIATHPLASVRAWEELKGVHPAVKRNAKRFYTATTDPPQLPPKEHKKALRFSEEQKNFLQQVLEKRERIAKKYSIKPFLLANKDQLQEITVTGKFDSLKQWQKVLFVSER